LPLVMLTSLGRRDAAAREMQFAAYLSKPIKQSQLYDVVVSTLATDHPTPAHAAEVEMPNAAAARRSTRTLLVEDNMVNQRLALSMLARFGYRADVATNGVEACKAVERQTYDLV